MCCYISTWHIISWTCKHALYIINHINTIYILRKHAYEITIDAKSVAYQCNSVYSAPHRHVLPFQHRPPVDRAMLVNLARGCNPGRLVSEWRHWRSLDGQLTHAGHSRMIGSSVTVRFLFAEENLLLITLIHDVAKGQPHDARERSLPGHPRGEQHPSRILPFLLHPSRFSTPFAALSLPPPSLSPPGISHKFIYYTPLLS